MKFNFIGISEELLAPISLLSDEYNFEICEDGIPVEVSRQDLGLYVSYNGKEGKIVYDKKVEFFRSFGLLIEAITENNTEFEKSEKPCFDTCGGMYDLSHGALVNMDTLKYTIRKMAVMGLNMFMMYSEESYEVPEYPYFGYLRGRYSFDEIKELDDYAYQFGIEIIPAMQTLGHLSNTLRWSCFSDIADTDDCLMVGEEKTYEFIEAMIRAASAPVRSKRIHIGLDETFTLGSGAYMTKHGYRVRGEIFMEHLVRVAKICEKLGLQAIMWAGMLLRATGSAYSYAATSSVIPEDVKKMIPENIALSTTSYKNTDVEAIKRSVTPFVNTGKEVHSATGAHDWHGFCVNYRHLFPAADAALTAYKEKNIKHVYNTSWGDDSPERDILADLLGFQQYAEFCYSEDHSVEAVCKRYNYCVQHDADMILGFGNIDVPDVSNLAENKTDALIAQFEKADVLINPSKYLMWQDPLLGKFDTELSKCDFPKHFRERGEYLRTFIGKYPAWDSSLDFYIALCDTLEIRCSLGVDMKKAYDEKNKPELMKIAEVRIPKIKELLLNLWDKNRILWFERYKAFGWEVLDRRYGCLMMRLNSVSCRIMDYCEGKIDVIEELQGERLPFKHNDNGTILYYNDYLHTSTAWGR